MSDALKKREQQLLRRGLGTGLPLFPGLPTLDSAGLSFDSPKRKIGEISQGILKGLGKGANFIQTLTAPDGITKNVTDPAVEYLSSPSSMEIAKKKNEIAQNEKMKENIKNLSLNELFYPDSKKSMGFDPVDVTAQNENIIKIENELGALEENDLTKQIKNLIAPSGVEDSSEAQKIITEAEAQKLKEFRDKEAEIADAQGKPEVGGEALQKAAAAAEDAFAGGVQQYAKDAGIDIPTTPNMSKEEALEKYKQEFANATGIDISGKVDKSSALMAMGLSLMQNRAGKGFNVGRILSSVGEAGEKALPALEKAKSEAKQAQLAAGKYALQQRRADVDAELATAKANNDFKKEIYLKWYASDLKMKEQESKGILDAELELLKAETTGGDYSKTKDRKFVDGQGSAESWKVPYVYDSKDPNGGFFLKPEAAIRKHVQGREGVVDARETISALRGVATEVAEGGGSIEVAYQKLHSLMKAIAPSKYLTGEPTAVEDYNYETKKLLNQYKRFLTQETGNGISNRDVEMWTDDLMGNIGFFTNLDATLNALDGLDQIFGSKQNDFDNALEELLEPSNHQEGTYDKILEKYGTFEDMQGLGSLVFVDGKLVRK